jgi:hypothetical protein
MIFENNTISVELAKLLWYVQISLYGFVVLPLY